MKHYDYQRLKDEEGRDEFRVTHVATDSRVATCYLESNAQFIVDALNFHAAICHGGAKPRGLSADPDFAGIVDPPSRGGGA